MSLVLSVLDRSLAFVGGPYALAYTAASHTLIPLEAIGPFFGLAL